MIRHIVMWKFRRDLEETPQQIAQEMKSSSSPALSAVVSPPNRGGTSTLQCDESYLEVLSLF